VSATVPAVEAQYAYRECERITRQAAANFYYGIRLLPRPKREAMSAVYAFARRVDDIGDDAGHDAHTRLAQLASERAMLDRVAREGVLYSEDPVELGLAHSHFRYGIPLDALELLIEGVELDVRGTRYETFEELVVYCRDVAGSIGRLCLAIFCGGAWNEPAGAAALADDLGVAMQLTNILRDVREDHERGRRYLPGEDLRRFGCDALPQVPATQAAALIRFEAARAREWFDRGLGLVALLDGRSASCVLAMTGIYRSILQRIVAEPEAVLRGRISLSTGEKAWLAARSLAGGHRTGGRRAGGRRAGGDRAGGRRTGGRWTGGRG
jgi:phytoene synthase